MKHKLPTRKPTLVQVDLSEIRRAFADYMASEGCSCCQQTEAHDAAHKRLGKLLRAKLYDDKSGYDFWRYRTEK